jgi:hypothetical protein
MMDPKVKEQILLIRDTGLTCSIFRWSSALPMREAATSWFFTLRITAKNTCISFCTARHKIHSFRTKLLCRL